MLLCPELRLELRDLWSGEVTERDPNIVKSSLSRRVTRDGITVVVEIVRLEDETKWSLGVVNAKNTSTPGPEWLAADARSVPDEKVSRRLIRPCHFPNHSQPHIRQAAAMHRRVRSLRSR